MGSVIKYVAVYEHRNEKAQQRQRRHCLNHRARQKNGLAGGMETHRRYT